MTRPFASARAFLADLADAALGPRCPLGCGARLCDRDRERHFRDEHAGEIPPGECHCGRPVVYGFDGDDTHTRGMCYSCDLVRCDAFPGACRDAGVGTP